MTVFKLVQDDALPMYIVKRSRFAYTAVFSSKRDGMNQRD